jgi:hypothetical protein
MINTEFFLQNFANVKKESLVKFARIDPDYVEGRPRLIFDGEDVVSGKQYPYLSSYSPQASERVMLIKGVIVGGIVNE